MFGQVQCVVDCKFQAYIVCIYICNHQWGLYRMTKPNQKKHKDGQLVIRINKNVRDEFVSMCEDMDTTAAREIRRFINNFMVEKRNP